MFPDLARLYVAAIEDADYKEEKLGLWRHVRGFDFSKVSELVWRPRIYLGKPTIS